MRSDLSHKGRGEPYPDSIFKQPRQLGDRALLASWFETRGVAALLTMRVWQTSSCARTRWRPDLILRSRARRGVSKDGRSTRRRQIHLRLPAARIASESCKYPSPRKRGRRECRVPAAPAASRGKNNHHTSIVTTGPPESPGIPCAMVLTVSFALSPVTGLVCHRRRRSCLRRLDASVGASGPHDFAVRKATRSSAAPPASIASHSQRP
jgi:hypothetical protein